MRLPLPSGVDRGNCRSACRYVPYFGENDDIAVDLTAYSKVDRSVVHQCLENEMDEEVGALCGANRSLAYASNVVSMSDCKGSTWTGSRWLAPSHPVLATCNIFAICARSRCARFRRAADPPCGD